MDRKGVRVEKKAYKPVYERVVTHDRPLSVTLIGKLLGVSRHTIYNMLEDGRLKGRNISSLLTYVREDAKFDPWEGE